MSGGLHNNLQNVQAVILAGGRDFGRCPLASRLPTPLWPVEGKAVLLRLLSYLAQEGLGRAVICGGTDNEIYQDAVDSNASLEVSFLSEPLPIGAAGCIRDAAGDQPHELLLVLHGTIVSGPPIEWLVKAHLDRKSDLTVILNPPRIGCNRPEFAGIYVCGREVVKHIPQEGYCDIKEGLIPSLWRAGKNVQVATLPQPSGTFRNAEGYLNAVFEYSQPGSFIHAGAQISTSAKICGAVIIMDNVIVCDDAVIIGPAIIEKDVVVGRNAVVSQSVLWAGSSVGENAQVNKCVVFYDTAVPPKAVLEDRALAGDDVGAATSVSASVQKAQDKLQTVFEGIKRHIPVLAHAETHLAAASSWLWFAVLFAAFFWLYRPEINQLWEIWLRSDEYSSGLLVPLFAAYIVWSRREELKQLPKQPLAAGLAVFLAAQAVRFFGLTFMYDSAQRLSLVLSAAALVLYLLGWKVFRRMLPILLFLFLMLPVPKSVQANIMAPLQDWATSSAIFSLEMMGFEVWREGNIIHLGNVTVAVAEACNGLRMITAFFVISGLVVLLVQRAWWEKLIIFLSAFPIGLCCNTLRLTMTALAFTVLKGAFWEKTFHDFGGLIMMPMALGAVMLELWVLRRLTIFPAYEAETA
jgi:exosortase